MVQSNVKSSVIPDGSFPLKSTYMVIKFNEDGEGKQLPYVFTSKSKAVKYANQYRARNNCETGVYSLINLLRSTKY